MPGGPLRKQMSMPVSGHWPQGGIIGDIAQQETLEKNKLRRKKRKTLKPIMKKHPEFELSYDMMLGIRTVVGRLEGGLETPSESMLTNTRTSTSTSSIINIERRDLSMTDIWGDQEKFSEVVRYRFPKEGSSSTPAHVMKAFKFKDYSPHIFKQLRSMFNVDPGEYMTDICGDFHMLEFMSNSKSGSFFFFTHNTRYLVKTITKSESKLLRRILQDYYSYICKHPHSLLTKFFGMHRVKPHKRKAIYFIITGSVFWTDVEVDKIYDLKGSTHGRRASKKDFVKKDQDFLNDGEFLKIGKDKAKLLKEQLRLDTDFLRKLQIMDYSLLVGIHYRRPSPRSFAQLTSFSPSRSSSKNSQSISSPLAKPEMKRTSSMPPGFGRNKTYESAGGSPNLRSSVRLKNGYKKSTPGGHIVPELVLRQDREPELWGSGARKSIDQEGKEDSDESSANSNPFTDTNGGMAYYDENGMVGDAIYFVGIIDILQLFNKRKKVENFFRSIKHDEQTISAVDPELYAKRLNRFFEDKVM